MQEGWWSMSAADFKKVTNRLAKAIQFISYFTQWTEEEINEELTFLFGDDDIAELPREIAKNPAIEITRLNSRITQLEIVLKNAHHVIDQLNQQYRQKEIIIRAKLFELRDNCSEFNEWDSTIKSCWECYVHGEPCFIPDVITILNGTIDDVDPEIARCVEKLFGEKFVARPQN
jgi:uncharacterized coiled-coil protein SlyX